MKLRSIIVLEYEIGSYSEGASEEARLELAIRKFVEKNANVKFAATTMLPVLDYRKTKRNF